LTWSCLQLIKRGDRSGEEELSEKQNQGKTSTTGLTKRNQTKITKKPANLNIFFVLVKAYHFYNVVVPAANTCFSQVQYQTTVFGALLAHTKKVNIGLGPCRHQLVLTLSRSLDENSLYTFSSFSWLQLKH